MNTLTLSPVLAPSAMLIPSPEAAQYAEQYRERHANRLTRETPRASLRAMALARVTSSNPQRRDYCRVPISALVLPVHTR